MFDGVTVQIGDRVCTLRPIDGEYLAIVYQGQARGVAKPVRSPSGEPALAIRMLQEAPAQAAPESSCCGTPGQTPAGAVKAKLGCCGGGTG